MNQNDILINVQVQGLNQINALSNAMRVMNANMAGVVRASTNLDARARSLSQALGMSSKGEREHAKSLKDIITNQSALGNELRRARADYNALTKAQSQSTSASYQSAKGLQQYEKSLRGIKARALVSDLRSVSTEMKRLGKDAQFTGRSMIIGITTPLLAFAQTGLNNFLELDKEMVRLNKLIDDMAVNTENALNKMGREASELNDIIQSTGTTVAEQAAIMVAEYAYVENGILAVSREFGISRPLIASVAGDFAELGLNANDSVLALTRLTAEAEKLGSLDIGPSKDLIQSLYSQSITIIQESALARGKLATAVEAEAQALKVARGQLYLFNAIENSTALSLADIAQAFPEVAAATTQFGLSMSEAAALLAPMKAAGFEVGASANSIKVSLQRLNDPTVKATERMIALSEATGYDFQQASSIGITAIDSLAKGFDILNRKTELGREGVQELFNTLFESRQGPRMQVLIENLALFNNELDQVGSTANWVKESVNKFNRDTAKGILPTVRTFSDLSAIARISAGQIGDSIEYLDEFGKKAEFVITAQSKNYAMQIREEIGKTIEDQRKEGNDLINKITSQAGRALVIQFAGPGAAAARAKTELRTALDSISASVEKMRNNFKILAADLISTLRPAIDWLSNFIEKVAIAFQNMSDSTKKFILIILGLLASLGPAVFAFGQARLAISTLSNVLLKLVPGLSIMTYETIAAAPALLNLSKPIGLVNGVVTTSASRFSILVARMASLEGPIGKISRSFGRLTGVLRNNMTAAREVSGAVNEMNQSNLKLMRTGLDYSYAGRAGMAGARTSLSSLPVETLQEPRVQTPSTASKPWYKNLMKANRNSNARLRVLLDDSRFQRSKLYKEHLALTLAQKGLLDKVLVNQNHHIGMLGRLLKFDASGHLVTVAKNSSGKHERILTFKQVEAVRLKAISKVESDIETIAKIRAARAARMPRYYAKLALYQKGVLENLSGGPLPNVSGMHQRIISEGKKAASGTILPGFAGAQQVATRMGVGRERGIVYGNELKAGRRSGTTQLARSMVPTYRGKEITRRSEEMILAGGIYEKLAKFYQRFKPLGDFISKVTRGIGTAVADGFKFVGRNLKRGAQFISNSLVDFYNLVSPKISAGLGRVGSAVNSSFNRFKDILYTRFTEPLIRNLRMLPGYIRNGMSIIATSIGAKLAPITNAISTKFNAFQDFLFANITSPMIGFFRSLPGKISGSVSSASNSIKLLMTRLHAAFYDPNLINSIFINAAGIYDLGISRLKAGIVNSINRVIGPIRLAMIRFYSVLYNPRALSTVFFTMAGAFDIGFMKIKNSILSVVNRVIPPIKLAMIRFYSVINNPDLIRSAFLTMAGTYDIGFMKLKQFIVASSNKVITPIKLAMIRMHSALYNPNLINNIFINMAGMYDIGMQRLKNGVRAGFAKFRSLFIREIIISSGQLQGVSIQFTVLDRLKNQFWIALDSISSVVRRGFTAIQGSVASGVARVNATIMAGAATTRAALAGYMASIATGLRSAPNKFANMFSNIGTGISNVFSNIGTNISNGFSNLGRNIRSGSGSVKDRMKGFIDSFRRGNQLVGEGPLAPGQRRVGRFSPRRMVGNAGRFTSNLTGVPALRAGMQARGAAMQSYTAAMTSMGVAPNPFIKQAKGLGAFIKVIGNALRIVKVFRLVLLGFGVATVLVAVLAAVSMIFNMIKGGGKTMERVKYNFVAAWNMIKMAIKAIIKPIRDAIATVAGLGGGKSSKGLLDFSQKIKEIAARIEQFVTKYVVPVIEVVMTQVVNFIDMIVKTIRGIIEIFKGNWQEGLKLIAKATGMLARIAVRLITLALKIWVKLWAFTAKAVITIIAGLAQAIVDAIGSAISWVFEKLSDLTESIPWLGDALGTAGEKVKSFTDGFSGVIGDISNFAKNGVDTLADGMTSAIDSVGNSAADLLTKAIGQAEKSLVDSGGMDLLPNARKQGEEDGEEYGEAFGDAGGQSIGEGMSGAAKDALNSVMSDLGQQFVDLVISNIQDSMKNLVSELTKVLEEQKDAALAAFDTQLENIEKLEKAEESLTKEMQYQSDRRRMIQERALQVENYNRNRALAIYEGRIDDARMLTLEDQKNRLEFTSNIERLDEDRRKDLASENLAALRDVINKAKDDADKFFTDQVNKFAEAAEAITKFPPLTIAEYQGQLDELQTLAEEIANENQGALNTALERMVDDLQTKIPNEGVPAFSNSLDQLVAVAKQKYGFETDGLGALTVKMLADIGGVIEDDTNINNQFNGLLLPLVTGAAFAFGTIYDITSNTLNNIGALIDEYNPFDTFAKAIANANREILQNMRQMLNSVASEVGWLLPYLDSRIISMAVIDELANNSGGGGGGDTTPTGPRGYVVSGYYEAWAAAARLRLGQDYGGVSPTAFNITPTTGATTGGGSTTYPSPYFNGGKVKSFAMGGINTNFVVPGFGSTPVPAILHGGEYVINSKAVSNMGIAALEALNNMRFARPSNAGYYPEARSGTSSTATYNIYVDTFIGEDEWFNQMTKKYNMNVLPRNQKSAGLEGRTLTSYSGLARGG